MRALLSFAAILIVACSPSDEEESVSDVKLSDEAPARSERNQILALTQTTEELGRNPTRLAASDGCMHYTVAPVTTAGERLRSMGWVITAENSLGTRTAVSFANSLEAGGSNLCQAHNGKIAIFENENLEYLLTRTGEDDELLISGIGQIQPVPNSERLRILDSALGYAQPLGDLVETQEGVRLEVVPEYDLACPPDLRIPNTYGEPIVQARARIIAYGWTPVDHRNDENRLYAYSSVLKMRDKGIVEVKDCSGTGYGLCGFDYTGPSGAHASIVTVGDSGYAVLDSSFSCSPN